MNREEIGVKESAELIDILLSKENEAAELKAEIDILKSEIQTRGIKVLDERNTKYVEFFGDEKGIASVSVAQKMEILNYFKLEEILGKAFTEEKISRVQAEVKYNVDKKFQQAVIALVTGDYAKGYTMEEVISSITTDEKKQKLLMKKLKGDYKKDKDTISSVLAVDKASLDVDVELHLISKILNWSLIETFFETEDESKFNKLKTDIKKCIIVDETVKIATKSMKEDNAA